MQQNPGMMPNLEAPSIEQQIAMQKMQRHLDEAKERLSNLGYQALEVVMTANGPLAYGVRYNLAEENNEVEIVYTPLAEKEDDMELPVHLAMVQLEIAGEIEDHGIKQLVLTGMGQADGASVLETAAFIQEAQLAQQIGVELTMMMAAHKEGQVPAEALNNANTQKLAKEAEAASKTPVDAKQTPGGIILP